MKSKSLKSGFLKWETVFKITSREMRLDLKFFTGKNFTADSKKNLAHILKYGEGFFFFFFFYFLKMIN